MNDPYPTRAQLRTEADASRAMAEQSAATEAYHKLVARFLHDFNRLNFPLGSPSAHYDMDDIMDTLTDTLKPRDAQRLEQAAMDLAKENML
jgi:hypothetical protein